MKTRRCNSRLVTTAICLAFATSVLAADFDGDGVADEFTITRDAAKAAKEAGIALVNPWKKSGSAKPKPEGLGFIVRLSRGAKRYLLCDPEFLGRPAWKEQKPPVETITRTDPRYRGWKKEVPALKADAIQFGTEAGIDILLYWDGNSGVCSGPRRSHEAPFIVSAPNAFEVVQLEAAWRSFTRTSLSTRRHHYLFHNDP